MNHTSTLDLHFGWTPSRLAVTEKAHKKGRDSEMGYTLVITDVDGGLAIEYRDFHFTAFGELDLQDPKIRAEFATIERTVAMMQLGFRVSHEGAFAGLLDVDALVRGYEALVGPEESAGFRQLVENPQLRPLLEVAVSKPWHAWVGAWIGGAPLLHVRLENRSLDPSRPGHVLLRYEQRCDDPRFMDAAGEISSSLVDDIEPAILEAKMRVDYERVVQVSLDPRTMIPAWAKDVMKVDLRAREAGSAEAEIHRVESHEWTFELVSE